MRFIKKVLMLVVLALLCITLYQWRQDQKNHTVLLNKIKLELENDRCALVQAATAMTGEKGQDWSHVHAKLYNTVVQVFAHKAEFNWLEPYKTPQQRGGCGTGFFIDESGILLTNAHVVDESKALYIQIPYFGKRRFDVVLLGVSPERDLALLQVVPDDLAIIYNALGGLPTLELGNSDTIRRADEVMALGYPLGQEFLKSTVGVVSGRQHMNGRSMIQIDAPINPGNSGGPAINKDGEVVGINTASIKDNGAQNIGYIIPVEEVKLFLKQLEETAVPTTGPKFLRKPFLGIIHNPGSDSLARFLGNPLPGGLYVAGVYKNSPLDKAGIQEGDMLYEIDGHTIDYFGDIQTRWSEDRIAMVDDYSNRLMPGDTIHLVYYRKGKRKEVAMPHAFSELTPVRIRYPAYEKIDYVVIGGMVIMELSINHLTSLVQFNTQLAKYADLKAQMEPALVITHILPNSEAIYTRVLKPGIIIQEINGVKITDLKALREQLTLSVKSGFLTIKSEHDAFAVLDFAKVLRDEPKLASCYYYTIAPFVQNLMRHIGSVTKV